MFVAPEGYQPVYNPSIPYLGPIHGGLRDGASIFIQGSVPKNITRFHVNLLCGDSESSDVALHFNPRFDGRDKVVFNSRLDGDWGSEEKIRKMPFSKGKSFEMAIMVNSLGYQIKVNGKDFFTFAHRVPVKRVRSIQVAGDVCIQTINVVGGGSPGGDMGGGYPGSHLPGMGGQPVYDPPLPYRNMIPGGMNPKRTIIIRGLVPYGAKSMGINFVVSRSQDIAFHINPRVKEGVVVRNNCSGGKWGSEEREINMNPFQEGQYFDMSIRCGNQRFKVFVNGLHLFDFSHRTSFSDIDWLEVDGDVQISYIHF
ncbi:galectin-4 [Austrofundulus limnaeus]|uniref:Galectin n=1 Tax=Austrofundulus limnaeus TaxID=52670 RepID=A0A2I4CKS6_AUSLI|nr:PREDICTED: galectin-4-like [Austrofundulus limnaeus]